MSRPDGEALASPASERNKIPIGDVLSEYLKAGDRVLEVASGFGAHVAYNCRRFREVRWYPTEIDEGCLSSIRAHLIALENPANVVPPSVLDVSSDPSEWSNVVLDGKFDLLFTANFCHITPWECTVSLFELAARVLKAAGIGKLAIYGPFAFEGRLVPESNVEFDRHLKLNDERWGIRDFVDLEAEAAKAGLAFARRHRMPANNQILVWTKL